MGVAQGDGWQNDCAVAAIGRGVETIDDFTSASARASFIAIFLRADIHLPAAQVAVKDNNIAKPATTRRCNQFLHPHYLKIYTAKQIFVSFLVSYCK